MNLAQLLHRAGRGRRDVPAIALGPAVWASYGELARRSAALAGALTGRFGLAPGDRVALVQHNGPAYIELAWAIWHAGLVAVPVNAKLHPGSTPTSSRTAAPSSVSPRRIWRPAWRSICPPLPS